MNSLASGARFFTALRVHHWSKNLLVFAPLALAHRLTDWERLRSVAGAALAFSIVASGTYLVNDCRDVRFDRLHPKKRDRLIASGAIRMETAVGVGLLLIVTGLAAAFAIRPFVGACLGGYLALSLLYSFTLKRSALLDVMVLSALYGIRVFAGGVAGRVAISDWLMALCSFLFVGLALLKRFADLRLHGAMEGLLPGRGYLAGDAALLQSIGVSCGNISVLVVALYLNSPQVKFLYREPRWLWLICPLMIYWLSRMWLLANRGEMEEDPIVVAARDPASYVVAAAIALLAYAAI